MLHANGGPSAISKHQTKKLNGFKALQQKLKVTKTGRRG
jgi:hypothetical protein